MEKRRRQLVCVGAGVCTVAWGCHVRWDAWNWR